MILYSKTIKNFKITSKTHQVNVYGVRDSVHSTPLYASELCLEHKMHGNSTSRAHGRPGVRNAKVSLKFITGNRPGLHEKYIYEKW